MGEQPKKTPCCMGLLAHVGASRREPRKNSICTSSKSVFTDKKEAILGYQTK